MSATMRCEHCGAVCPANARFCIECGRPVVAAATGATTRLAQLTCPACSANGRPGERFCADCGTDMFAPRRTPQRPAGRSHARVNAPPPTLRVPMQPHLPSSHASIRPGTIIMAVGIMLLLISHSIWPGLLLVIGLGQFFNNNQMGHARQGLRQLLWLGGLTLLIATNTFWPGIIGLFVLSKLLD